MVPEVTGVTAHIKILFHKFFFLKTQLATESVEGLTDYHGIFPAGTVPSCTFPYCQLRFPTQEKAGKFGSQKKNSEAQ